jgi:hypothetical protein
VSESLQTRDLVADHQDAFGLTDQVTTGDRGLQLLLGRRAGQSDGSMLGQDLADDDGLVGEHVRSGPRDRQNAEHLALGEEAEDHQALHAEADRGLDEARPANRGRLTGRRTFR